MGKKMPETRDFGPFKDVRVVKTSSGDSVQIRALKGHFEGCDGYLVPYPELCKALHIPPGYLMVGLSDFGDEIDVELLKEAAVVVEEGIFHTLPGMRCNQYLKKEEIMEVLDWLPEIFIAEFFICKLGWPLLVGNANPVEVYRNKDRTFIWITEFTDGMDLHG